MQIRTIGREEMLDFVRALLADYRVIAPVEAEPGFYRFEEIEDEREVILDYGTTILPPKKAFFPQRQVLFKFTTDSEDGRPSFEPVIEQTPQVILGVHPCDLAGIGMLDWVFERDHADEHYLAPRRATLLVGVDCQPDEHCFCTGVGTDAPKNGYDLFLTPVDGGYLVDMGSEEGRKLIETYDRGATPEDLASAGKFRRKKREELSRHFTPDVLTLPLIFQYAMSSPIWELVAEKCLNCGTCNLVCPTCFCFDVEDCLDPDGQGGVRQRVWDSCHLSGFAQIAGGHNFRPDRSQRLRHRLYKKYQYLMTLYGTAFCTGCGRCGRSCPVDINIVDTVNALVAEKGEEVRHVG